MGAVNGGVFALACPSDAELVAAGQFTTADGDTANRIASWTEYPTDVQSEGVIASHPWLQIAPNPASMAPMTIRYRLPEATVVRVEVFGASGARVCRLADRMQAAGEHEVTWNGRNTTGRAVPRGIYFVRMTAGKQDTISKITVLR
jgi:acetyl-CoA acetyltransferase